MTSNMPCHKPTCVSYCMGSINWRWQNCLILNSEKNFVYDFKHGVSQTYLCELLHGKHKLVWRLQVFRFHCPIRKMNGNTACRESTYWNDVKRVVMDWMGSWGNSQWFNGEFVRKFQCFSIKLIQLYQQMLESKSRAGLEGFSSVGGIRFCKGSCGEPHVCFSFELVLDATSLG